MAFYKFKENMTYDELINKLEEIRTEGDYTQKINAIGLELEQSYNHGCSIDDLRIQDIINSFDNINMKIINKYNMLNDIDKKLFVFHDETIRSGKIKDIENIAYQRKYVEQEILKTKESLGLIKSIEKTIHKMKIKPTKTKDYASMTRPQLIKELAENRCGEYILKINDIEKSINEIIKQDDISLALDFDRRYQTLSDIQKQLKQKNDNLIGILETLVNIQHRTSEELLRDIIQNDCQDVESEQLRIKQAMTSVNELKIKILKKSNTIKALFNKNVNKYDWKVLNRIKDVLIEKRIDQNLLVEKLEMDRSTVSSLLNNKTMTTLSNAFKIAYLLDTSVNDLFYTSSQTGWNDMTDEINKQYENVELFIDEGDKLVPFDDFCMPHIAESKDEYNVEKINKEQVKNKIELIIEGDKLSSDKIEEYFKGKGKVKKISIEYEDVNDKEDINSQDTILSMSQKFNEMLSKCIEAEYKKYNNKS